ncbi:hypothetical protein BDA96_03G322400 [Sorghum bicolor]|jgi:hypothetical protein|uniref:Uncharacterized protein n=2 Tax=Sorghum bicolor TaxID=4558 RepID=A0A921RG08_SORBI|nr:uncharacterized protein LOC8072085 [Sorghum bicolor]EES01489.1 hypothetical protein SORBI_3003G298700 [Sorghum bicolor]KAG0539432.1 hypothetical protein BDA96_03G322400 [Sorghum bicolor]|eukprot:XP_002456369.1 uncharacterized protein LOC8072085 [Sorghum bicolor]
MAASARHLFLAALSVAVLAVAAPRSADAWGGGRFFFSKTARPAEATVEPDKAASVPTHAAAADTDAAPAFSRPSTGGGSGRGYGLYGRPEENYPPDYFRRGVHRNAEKLTTTTTDVPATAGTVEAAGPVRGRGGDRERVRTTFPEDGSGRGRPPTDVPATTTRTEEAGGAGGDLDGVQPYPENGSGRGRPPWYYTGFHRQQEQEQRDYGMSDTRLYQNGRYYYDVEAGRYGYGRESNPMRTRPDVEEEEFGSGYGRPRGGSYHQQQQYGNGEEFGNAAMDRNTNGGFQEEAGQSGLYIP